MVDFVRFTVEFFRSPRRRFAGAMIVNASILEFLAVRMIQVKSISNPLIQFLLYSVGAGVAIMAAIVLLRGTVRR